MNENLIAALRYLSGTGSYTAYHDDAEREQICKLCSGDFCYGEETDANWCIYEALNRAANALESAYAEIEALKEANRDIRQHSVSHELYAQVCAERDEARKDCAEKNHMEIYQAAIDRYGAQAQMWMCVEECAELIQAINKYNRGIGDPANIAEEIADVEITIAQLEMILGNTDAVEAEIKRKLDRLRRRLHDGRKEA